MKFIRVIMITIGSVSIGLSANASSGNAIGSKRHGSMLEQSPPATCNIHEAFQHGANGNAYPNSCAKESNPDFLFAFQSGQHVLELRNDLSELNSELKIRQDDLLTVKGAVYQLEAVLATNPPPATQRLHILRKLHALDVQRSNIEAEIEYFEFERSYRQKLCDSMEASYSES